MNTNLLNIVKRIIAECGENILSDPARLKALFSDYAKNELKEDRVAFGRCIEIGSYSELKKTRTAEERRRVKAVLADQLHTKTGIDKDRCGSALDLLEAVMFGTVRQSPATPPPVMPGGVKKTKSVSKKTIIFGIAGAIGGAVGSLFFVIFLSDKMERQNAIIRIASWTAFVALGASLGLLAAQSIYLKKKLVLTSLIKTAVIGLLIGAVAGAIAQIVFGYTSKISTFVEIISRIVVWGIMGLGIGLGVSYFVPNFPKKRAMGAGFLGGLIGGAIFSASLLLPLSGFAGVLMGDISIGFFIGLTISFMEEALREAWLTVIWGKNETKTITLGAKPVVFGSSPEADIYLPKDKEPPVRATVQIESSKVVMYDKKTNQRRELQNGNQVDFEKVSFVVNIKK
jgi:hypothetical protein